MQEMESTSSVPHLAFLAGAWQETERTFPVRNTATGKIIVQVADCGLKEAKQAADAVARSFENWKNRTAYERAEILYHWYQLMLVHEESLAHLMAVEMGKPIREARAEVRYPAGLVSRYAEKEERTFGEMVP